MSHVTYPASFLYDDWSSWIYYASIFRILILFIYFWKWQQWQFVRFLASFTADKKRKMLFFYASFLHLKAEHNGDDVSPSSHDSLLCKTLLCTYSSPLQEKIHLFISSFFLFYFYLICRGCAKRISHAYGTELYLAICIMAWAIICIHICAAS